MPRLGLCCIFRDQPIKFRTATAAALGRIDRNDALHKLSEICLANAESLLAALRYCRSAGIGCFRVNSQILPLKTHPTAGYEVEDLPAGEQIVARLKVCGEFVREQGLRTAFHPDQFVVLNSPRPEVVAASLAEIEYQAEVAEWIGADVINVHAGGAFGAKPEALARLAAGIDRLSSRSRSRLTLENDDRSYSPAELLPFCQEHGIPLVYDVHHHRCLSDGLSVEETTEQAMATWDREPMFHISSPLEGWDGPKPQRHHDYIDLADFPNCWRGLDVTIEVEAKAKELAVLQLKEQLSQPLPQSARKPRGGTSRN